MLTRTVVFGALLLLAALAFARFLVDTAVTTRAADEPTSSAATAASVLLGDTRQNAAPDGVADRTEVGATARTRRSTRIRVVFPDERPAAGAELRYWRDRTPEQQARDERTQEEAADVEVALRATGELAIADHRGIVEVAAEPDSVVCARLGGHYGQLELDGVESPTSSPVLLVIEKDLTLRVRVVDTAERSCEGIAVQAEVCAESRTQGSVDRSSEARHTGENGCVVLPHLQRQLPMPGPDVVAWSMTLRCSHNEDRMGSRAVSSVELASAAVLELVVPIGGTVAAQVLDADGRPWSGPTHVFDLESDECRSPESSVWEQGLYWFRQVPLGRRWQLRCQTKLGEKETTVDFTGPTRPDEIASVALQVPEHTWNVRGRLVRRDGASMDHVRVSCRSETAPEEEPRISHGTFFFDRSLPLSVQVIDDLALHVHLVPHAEPVVIRIDRALPSGRTDLGDVVVPVPAGEVLLASVEVKCEGRAVTDTAHVGLWLRGSAQRAAEEVSCARRREGSTLALFGPRVDGQLELRCSRRGCRPAVVSVGIGEHEVVELMRMAELSLRVRPPAVPRELMEAELVSQGDAQFATLDGPDVFPWYVTPGKYSLRIRVQDRVIWQLESIELAPGPNVWPVDGTALDLRHGPRAIHLDVRAADGGTVEDVHTYALPSDVNVPLDSLADHELPFTRWFVPRQQPTDVLVRAEGFVPIRMKNPTTDTLVALTRLTTVSIRGPGDPRATVLVRLVESGIPDLVLRAIHAEHTHDPEMDFPGDTEVEIAHVPGAVLELCIVREGRPGPSRRVTVGTVSPQLVELR